MLLLRMGEIGHLQSRQRHKSMIRVAIAGYCSGLVICYMFLAFGEWDSLPNIAYFIWDKTFGGSLMMWLSLYMVCAATDRKAIAPVLFFSIIRVIWEIVVVTLGIGVNNSTGICILFVILIVVIYVLTLKKTNFLYRFFDRLLLN